MDHVPPLPFHMETLTNKHVIKLFHESKSHFRAGSQRILHRWVCSVLNKNENEIHLTSLIKRIKSVIANLRKLKTRRRYEEADAYEKHLFQIPKRFHIKPTSPNLDTQHKLISLKKKLSVLYIQLSNEKKKVKRKNMKIKNLKKEIDFVKVLNKRPKSTAKYVQTDAVKTLPKISRGTQCNLTRLDSIELKNEITYWQNEVIKMNEPDQPVMPVTSVKENSRGNPFSHKIRECVLACISKNVPMQNISDVIASICQIFNVEEIDTLPSVASIHNISREAKAICNKQLEEAIKHSNNLTIMKDATTKQGRQFYGAKINCSTGEFTLGLKEISSGTAEKYVNATIDMVNEASSTKEFVGKLTNCMTDRSATELKSNKLLSELKSKELPNDSELNEFQCSVHPLLQFADEVEKVAKEIEKKHDVKFKNLFRNKGESYSHNLIRCVSKLFHSDKVGDPLFCRTFLRENDIVHVPILDFVGNRFNTLFYNACGTFCLKDLLTTYITSSKDKPNFMLTSILQLFENEVITAIIQSIGIIYIKITAPYFSLASQNKPALEMATTYNTLVDELEKIVKNPALLLDTEYVMFPGHPSDISTFNLAVLKPLIAYSTVVECLGQMASSILSKCRKFFTNYLPGGKFHNPSVKTIQESSTCPSNNISLERMMGQLDRQKNISPNISLTTINAKLMLKNNKTMAWLGEKNEQDKIMIMAQARKAAEILKEKSIADDINLEQERRDTIKGRIEEKEAKLKKSQEHLKDVINQIEKMGGKWKNEFEMNRYIQALQFKKDKLNALKTQIIFRKDVEKQICDKALFRKNLDIQQLQKNLINLMEEENKISNLENAIVVPMEVDADINLSAILSNNDNPSSPLPAPSTIISNPDQLSSIPEPSSSSSSSSSVPKPNQSATPSAPTQHELISKPPCWFNKKYITHTWDEGSELTTYHGKIVHYAARRKTFRVIYWNELEGQIENTNLEKYDLTVKELKNDISEGTLKIIY